MRTLSALPLILALSATPALAQPGKPAQPAQPAEPAQPAQPAQHHLVIHVDTENPVVMTEALANAANVIKIVHQEGGTVAIEIVANGNGAGMFATELTPIKKHLKEFHAKYPDVVLSECAISLAHIEKRTHRKLTVLPEAHTVPSGAVRIMELEEQHWAYLKP